MTDNLTLFIMCVLSKGSSLIAFAVGGKFDPNTSGIMVIGAHTDSPCPKLKPVREKGS